ncbi:ATPase domain-containing protein [Ramlibacter monticola]|uniref:non-specific serine/threonine protein kinase n=1 Tax=Ramlibacter monticola TaxID=1926872 RepID=A0A936YY61_9BURK|nr:ATPase domain-containing protein [Ramlibacter monticola]MBL0391093.1 AAA family ATPase [Ramlibacter monticola]
MNAANDRAIIHRLLTGVPGLDDVLGGGLPEFSFNVIAGPPGSGKTTLAHQIMFALASAERPALYFTVLGEPPVKMLRYQQQFDFFDAGKLQHAIHFINLAEEAASGDLGKVLHRILAEIEAKGPGLVFVDSFRSLATTGADGAVPLRNLQEFVQELGVLMTSWQATTFLVGEYPGNDNNPVFTVADGLIWLRQSEQRNSVVRKLEIAKMRGQATLAGLHSFRIDSAGIHVFSLPALDRPQLRAAPHPSRQRVRMGVEGLDDMLGGGLPRGYSLLVAGPSGAGKSILASSFLVEGAAEGETGVLATFEQRPGRSRGRALAELIAAGRVGVIDARAPGLSVDEICTLLVAEITRLKATRVVIDSLSGFELALAPTFREDFRESLSRMVLAIASTGVTIFMTSELEDRFLDLRFSPYGTAFLTDAIIVQRYVEVDSRLLRVMAVAKVRDSAHSNELRLFHIDDNGIRLGGMLHQHEGLLGGRPTLRKRDPGEPIDPSWGSPNPEKSS